MPIKLRCPQCQKSFLLSSKNASHTVTCPACGRTFAMAPKPAPSSNYPSNDREPAAEMPVAQSLLPQEKPPIVRSTQALSTTSPVPLCVACPTCGLQMADDGEMQGQLVACPRCRHTFAMPHRGIEYGGAPPHAAQEPIVNCLSTLPYNMAPISGRMERTMRYKGKGWFAAGACVGCLGCILALAGIGAIFSLSGARPASSISSGAVGEATHRYWLQMRRITGSIDSSGPPSQRSMAWNAAANRLERLPTLNVDPDASQVALDLAFYLRIMAGHAADSVDPIKQLAFLGDAYHRGQQGDPFGAVIDRLSEQQELLRRIRVAIHNANVTRASLTTRYGIEFPPIY